MPQTTEALPQLPSGPGFAIADTDVRLAPPPVPPVEHNDPPPAYLPGLDGMRALAVLAVLLFHAGTSWLPGGFLGVEVFFVISGYIITRNLLAEWRARGRIDVRAFWLRRARRLLPAVYVLLVALIAWAVFVHPEEAAELRRDSLAALAYVTNWYLVFVDEPYFETFGRPSLLRHLWSLAVEEQFYLLWPVVLTAALGVMRPRFVALLTVAAAAGSAVAMGLLFAHGADPSDLYYRTDTRVGALLLGAALAFAWTPGATSRGFIARRPRLVNWSGFVALIVLVCLCAFASEQGAFLYKGGFALTSAASALLIVAAVHPRTRIAHMLGVAPLRWVGLRSYAMYLWHWPVLMFTRPRVDVPLDGAALIATQLAITFTLAAASYALVEQPARTGAIGAAWAWLRRRRWSLSTRQGFATSFGAAGAFVAVAALAIALLQAPAPDVPSYLALQRVSIPPAASAAGYEPRPQGPVSGLAEAWAWFGNMAATQKPRRSAHAASRPAAPPSSSVVAPVPRAPAPPAQPAITARVTAVGDSVMLGAASQLVSIGSVAVDAAVGRQVSEAIALMRALDEQGRLGDIVVIQLGNNGTFTDRQFDEIMSVLGPSRRAVFVNVRVPRDWERTNNAVIARGVARHANARLADWHALSEGRPELFWDDRVHLRPTGAQLYVDLVRSFLLG